MNWSQLTLVNIGDYCILGEDREVLILENLNTIYCTLAILTKFLVDLSFWFYGSHFLIFVQGKLLVLQFTLCTVKSEITVIIKVFFNIYTVHVLYIHQQ